MTNKARRETIEYYRDILTYVCGRKLSTNKIVDLMHKYNAYAYDSPFPLEIYNDLIKILSNENFFRRDNFDEAVVLEPTETTKLIWAFADLGSRLN